MSKWMKKSSGVLTGSGILVNGMSCRYFGFVLKTGGANKTFKVFNAQSAVAGKEVEDMLCDGNKPTDGHSHSNPVHCDAGLYYQIEAGGSAIIYYMDERI